MFGNPLALYGERTVKFPTSINTHKSRLYEYRHNGHRRCVRGSTGLSTDQSNHGKKELQARNLQVQLCTERVG